MNSKYYIVYPRGDKSKLAVVEISYGMEYELSDYAVASRQNFDSEDEANTYARELARKHNLDFECDGPDYLD